MSFKIAHNFEFYCYVKASLPDDYTIISEPSKNYFSEWEFHYKLYFGNKLIDEIKGDYRKIKDGELVSRGIQIIQKVNNRDNDYRK